MMVDGSVVALVICTFTIVSAIVGMGWRLGAKLATLEAAVKSLTGADLPNRLTRLEERHHALDERHNMLVEALELGSSQPTH